MIKEQPQETRICHDRESRNISRGKRGAGGYPQNVRGALPWRRAACSNSEFQIIQTVQSQGRAVQGSSSDDTGCAGYLYHQSSPPSRPLLPTPSAADCGGGPLHVQDKAASSETTVSHPQVPSLPLSLSWGSGCLKELCESEQASERGRCPCAGAVPSVGDRCTVMRALCGRCGLKF